MRRLIGLFQIVVGALISREVIKFKSFAALFEMCVVLLLFYVLLILLRIDSFSPLG